MKATELLVLVDFAESYTNSQQDAIQSAYFGQQSFSIFTACTYSRENEAFVNDNVIVVSESPDHSRMCSMSCVQEVVSKVEYIRGRSFDKLIIWSNGCASQFRSKYVFFILTKIFAGKSLSWYYNERQGKGPMVGIGGTVKNVVFRKVKSGHATVNTLQSLQKQCGNLCPKFQPYTCQQTS